MNTKSFTQTWLQLSSIQVGGSICLPVIMIGHVLSENYGFKTAVAAIAIGNLILLLLSLAATSRSAKERKSTVENASLYFGEQGSSLFAWLMVVCLLGWFAIQLNMMHESAWEIIRYAQLEWMPEMFLTIFIGGGITAVVVCGLSGMGWMASLCAPLLIATLGFALYQAPIPAETLKEEKIVWGSISLVMAVSIATVIDLPNFFRYARSQKDCVATLILLFGVATPLIEGIGVYFASSLPGSPLLEALKLNQTGFWTLWSVSFLLVGGWITNNTNLFSAVVSAEKLLPTLSEKKRTLVLGGLGTLLACANPAEYLEFVVNAMGIAVASMGGVIITGRLFPSVRASKSIVLSYPICWFSGAFIGYFALIVGPSITGIALMDAFLVSGLLVFFKHYLERGKVNEAHYSR
jgi:purine-cytosine permease-like protein